MDSEPFDHGSTFQVVDDPTRQMWDASKRFVEAMCNHENPYSLTFLGRSGCGKTHLMWEIFYFSYYNLWRTTGVNGVTVVRDIKYCDWAGAIKQMKDGDYGLLDRLAKCWFLALDDFGMEMKTEWATSQLTQLVNRRLGMWTAYNTNKDLETVAEADERIASRFFRNGGEVLRLENAQDWNLRDDL